MVAPVVKSPLQNPAKRWLLGLLVLISFGTHAGGERWQDESGLFRLFVFDQSANIHSALLYGLTQRVGPGCAAVGACAFVLRGDADGGSILVFEPLVLSPSQNPSSDLAGHQSELPGRVIDPESMRWSFDIVDSHQARLACVRPRASCDYFEAVITLYLQPR
jgi:hypothetical protein